MHTSKQTALLARRNRTAELKISNKKFYEPVPRPNFLTKKFEPREILLPGAQA